MTLAIYGFGGMGRDLVATARSALKKIGRDPAELIFIDDNVDAVGTQVCGLPVKRLADLRPGDEFILSVGNSQVREKLDRRCLKAGLKPFSLLADDHLQGVDVLVGEGAVFCARTMVTASVRIGRQIQCNIYSHITHDCLIGDYVTFAPRVSCNGNVHIGDHAYIGTGAVIKQGTSDKPLVIGAGAVVGMGAVVTKDVPPGAVVVGNPARALIKG